MVHSGPVERALRAVPRHVFVPGADVETAYSDEAIVTHTDAGGMPISSSSQPAIVATMLTQLGVAPGDRVLEVGAGTGYNAALLAEMAGADGAVTTVDLDPEVAAEARAHLAAAGFGQVEVIAGDGWAGQRPGAPYDRIIATVGVWDISPAWIEQLDVCGILVVPLWLRAGVQVSVALRRDGRGLTTMSVKPCGFMRLRGAGAGPESYVAGNGWSASLDGPDPDIVPALSRLLADTPAVGDLPELDRGWFVGLALANPDVIQIVLQDPARGPVSAPGLLDPQYEGLAVVVDGRLLSYGAPEVGEHLRDLLKTADHVSLGDLRLDVVPGDVPEDDLLGTPLAVLRRPSVTIVARRVEH